MTYAETLAYLYAKLPLFSRTGSAAYKKDLTNTRALCAHLQDPQKQFRSIHVGGTNGKGSVSHSLAAILQTAGYKTGLYTSPHLKDFRERIRINGNMVPEEWVVSFVEGIDHLIAELEPSFFEVTVAMAFAYFAQEKVDVAIIEVGLGGRLDSTNIILPELSVITNIGWDHMNILGDTLEQIAGEKGGIIKENVPVVVGERKKETDPVFQRIAAEKSAPLYFADDLFQVSTYRLRNQLLEFTVWNAEREEHRSFGLDLTGLYQLKNACTVLQAVEVLRQKSWKIEEHHIIDALAHVKERTGLHGRWELIRQKPDLVLEVAHNEDGMREMIRHLQQQSYRNVHVVFGMVKDKEPDAVLQLLPQHATYYFTQAHIPRALDATTLAQKAATFGLTGAVYEDVDAAVTAALQQTAPDDLVLVCGSVFLVGEVTKELFATT